MKRWFPFLAFWVTLLSQAGEFQSSLVVQTGVLKESDLVVRNISDLENKKTCLAFYVRTSGTSPVIFCYDAAAGFGAALSQVGHLTMDDLVIRKLEDAKNNVFCMVAYVSTPGTSPAVDCYVNPHRFKDHMVESAHLREGDLHVRRIHPDASKTCLVAYVATEGTSPSVLCYDLPIVTGAAAGAAPSPTQGSLYQNGYMKEGDLIVRKVVDNASKKACLVTYVATKGSSTHLFCYNA
ncbi:conserved exported hypothetical protein [Gammaproteobacteria bacterium]